MVRAEHLGLDEEEILRIPDVLLEVGRHLGERSLGRAVLCELVAENATAQTPARQKAQVNMCSATARSIPARPFKLDGRTSPSAG